MSEFINNQDFRINSLLEFSKGMIEQKDGAKLYKKHQAVLENITPFDHFKMCHLLVQEGFSVAVIKKNLERIMNTYYGSLKKYQWEKPKSGHPLYHFMQENRELEKKLNSAKLALHKNNYKSFTKQVAHLKKMENHYLRKENILFPYLEKVERNQHPLQILWSIHDDIRKNWKKLDLQLKNEDHFTPEIYKIVGELFFLMYGMIFKEELVLFPIAMKIIPSTNWQQMQSEEIGYSFIKVSKTEFQNQPSSPESYSNLSELFWKVETGELSKEQLELLLNNLPIDITFVDENDEVRYFSKPKDRFFPRSPAIIGRKVQNCHPPESVHIVAKILKEFKAGNKSEAKFWIQMKGRFILIRYFALRDAIGNYKGVLEVGQDITKIRQYKGERRLLDWD